MILFCTFNTNFIKKGGRTTEEKKQRTWVSVKAQLRPWAKQVFENLKFEIYLPNKEGKLVKNTKEEKQFDDLLPDLISKKTQAKEREYFVVKFEDDRNLWDDAADIIVKTYETQAGEDIIRTEIFCSGTAPKRIYYKDKLRLDYCGLKPTEQQIIAAVMIEGKKR